MLNVFSKGRRISYDCFAIEVRLKAYSLGLQKYIPIWPTQRSTPRLGYLPNLNFCGKTSRHFSVRRFLWENFQAPTNKDLAFVTVPSSLMLRWHLGRHFCETLHVLRSDEQTCGHDLKYGEKRQVNTRVNGISHIWKSSWLHVRLAW